MQTRVFPLLAVALVAATPALAQERSDGRYAIAPTADGYLKLDSRTGEVTDCRRQEAGTFRCTLVPDERAALQDEIDRLAGENASLRSALEGAGVAPPAAKPPGNGLKDGSTTGGQADKEVDRALSIMERFLRRMMSVMREEPAQP